MNRIILRIASVLLLIGLHHNSTATEWFAAPDGGFDGNGTRAKPWPLHVALTQNTVIKPGDTLNLRGGMYQGPGFICTLSGTYDNYVTVRSYAGEWAIISDGLILTLGADLPNASAWASSFGVIIQGSQHLPEGTLLSVDAENIQLLKRTSGRLDEWQVCRGWNGTLPTAHRNGTPIGLRSDFITHTGSYVKFQSFEITPSENVNRVVNATNYLGCGLNFLSGHANKALNLVVHNVGHPGIGFWKQGQGGEINGCILYGNGVYDNNGSWTRGNAVYAQNETGTVLFKNNLVFRNFTYGMKGYGETGPVQGFQFINNMAFAAPNGFPLEISSGSSPMKDNSMEGNFVLGTIMAGYVSRSNVTQHLVRNHIIDGQLFTKEFVSGSCLSNVVFLPYTPTENGLVSFTSANSAKKSQLNFVWNHNQYFLRQGSKQRQWAYTTLDGRTYGSDGSGNLLFQDDKTNSWKDVSGFDSQSTCQHSWPTNYLLIRAQRLDYDPTRHYVIVISTDQRASVVLPLKDVGLSAGESYELRDAQNWSSVIRSGLTPPTGIELPLNLTSVAPITGQVWHFANEHTNVKYPGLFNVFIVRKLAPPPPRLTSATRVL